MTPSDLARLRALCEKGAVLSPRAVLPLLKEVDRLTLELEEATPCDCGSVHNLDEDGCCRTCGCDLNVPLSWWQAGFREQEDRALSAESSLSAAREEAKGLRGALTQIVSLLTEVNWPSKNGDLNAVKVARAALKGKP